MSTQTETAAPSTTTTKIQALRGALKSAFIGRDAEIDAVLVALLAREHCLLLGPPGTAKSALTQAIAAALPGRYFQTLLTRFSAPEEVFGPVSIASLKAGRYERLVDGYLPTATVAFLDEIFKANSAILNSLLTALNERAYDQGAVRQKIPLEVVIGASNELPEDDEALGALYDRFMLRRWVEYVSSRDERRALLRLTASPAVAVRLTDADLADARSATDAVTVPDEVIDVLLDVRDALARDVGIVMSDRRLRKALALVRASATLNGRDTAIKSDVLVLADSAWQTPDQRHQVRGVVAQQACPDHAEALRLLDAATEAFGRVDLKQISASQIGEAAEVNRAIGEIVKRAKRLDGADEVVAQIQTFKDQVARAVTSALGM